MCRWRPQAEAAGAAWREEAAEGKAGSCRCAAQGFQAGAAIPEVVAGCAAPAGTGPYTEGFDASPGRGRGGGAGAQEPGGGFPLFCFPADTFWRLR